MPRRPTAPARVLRGLVVAAVGMSVAAAGHAYAGGAAAVTPSVVLVALLVSAGCVVLSDRRWTVARLLTALVVMQVAVHAALWFEGSARTADVRLSAVAAPTHSAHEHAAGATTLTMVLAHLVAVVVAALLLAGADLALAALVALARRLLGTAVVPPGVPWAPVARGVRYVAAAVLELGAVGRRGPPVGIAPA
jgi:hypothetical protein